MGDKMSKLRKLIKEGKILKKELQPFVGLTFKEAEKIGFNEKMKNKQQRLWYIGFQIDELKRKLNGG